MPPDVTRMRYTVRFAHARYLDLAKKWLEDDAFQVPPGVYRGLDVVVEAPNAVEALEKAVHELGWPDHELNLIPFSVTGETSMRAELETRRSSDALLEFWRTHELHDGGGRPLDPWPRDEKT